MLQFLFLWQVAEQEQKANLLISEMTSHLSLYQIRHIVTSVIKFSRNSLDPAFQSLRIAHNVGHSGQPHPDAGAVLISQALFYVVFLIPLIGNICVILGFPIKLRKIAFLCHGRCS